MISAKVYKLNHKKTLDKLKFKDTTNEKLAVIFRSVRVTKARDTLRNYLGLKEGLQKSVSWVLLLQRELLE